MVLIKSCFYVAENPLLTILKVKRSVSKDPGLSNFLNTYLGNKTFLNFSRSHLRRPATTFD